MGESGKQKDAETWEDYAKELEKIAKAQKRNPDKMLSDCTKTIPILEEENTNG